MQTLRRKHSAWAKTVDVKRLVFVDECGVHIAMTRPCGRAPKGQRVVGRVPRNRGRVLTVIGAMRATGRVATRTFLSATTGNVFEHFVKQALLPMLTPGDIVVWDNLGAHKLKTVRALLESAGAYIHWQPPYTPEVNAIEAYWAWLKHRLRSAAARSLSSLRAAIHAARRALRPHLVSAWVRHAGYPGAPPS